MSSTYGQLEAAVLETLRPQLEADGFEVFLHPSRSMLPPFLRTYQPDAIAIRGDKKIAIEVTSYGGQLEEKLENLRELFSERADWELRIAYAPSRVPDISVPPREVIEEHLNRIPAAFDTVGPTASLLLAWSVFEAAARSLMQNDLGRPQAPARLLEVLASDGYIAPGEADVLRRLGRLRNEAAHGRLDVVLTRDDLAELVQITRTILELHEQGAPETPE
jgi:hypothetical protein